MEIRREYEKIKEIFKDADEKQLKLIDGSIMEMARIKVELDKLNKIVEQTGLIKVNPKNTGMQKELPVSKVIVKLRANYLNYVCKLSKCLGVDYNEDEDDLNEFE